MSDKTEAPVPDLKSLLAEASRPAAQVTVPIKQGLAEQIRQAEAEMEQAATAGLTGKRAASGSPVKAAAERVEALRREMAASALTFHFSALSEAEREQVRQAMGGRDNGDELNMRAIAAMCRKVVTADGQEYAGGLEWTDFRDLRESLGAQVFDATIDEAATRASGAAGWSVPFSSAASRILATGT